MALTANIRDVTVERYFPDVLAPAKEFQAIAEVENNEFKKAWQAVWKQMLNTFVYDLDTDGASRWESMLQIYPEPTATLEERRQAILLRINAMLPYTERKFQQIVDGVYGEGAVKVHLNYDKYEMRFELHLSVLTERDSISMLARSIVPANLTLHYDAREHFKKAVYIGVALSHAKKVTIRPPLAIDTQFRKSSYIGVALSRLRGYRIGVMK